MSLLTELGFILLRVLQICRAYGAGRAVLLRRPNHGDGAPSPYRKKIPRTILQRCGVCLCCSGGL
jgi:hypothetical protein